MDVRKMKKDDLELMSNKDITLQLRFENSAYNTYLNGFSGTITIIALD